MELCLEESFFPPNIWLKKKKKSSTNLQCDFKQLMHAMSQFPYLQKESIEKFSCNSIIRIYVSIIPSEHNIRKGEEKEK